MVLVWCWCGAAVVLVWCYCGAAVVLLWCCCGGAVVLLWCCYMQFCVLINVLINVYVQQTLICDAHFICVTVLLPTNTSYPCYDLYLQPLVAGKKGIHSELTGKIIKKTLIKKQDYNCVFVNYQIFYYFLLAVLNYDFVVYCLFL